MLKLTQGLMLLSLALLVVGSVLLLGTNLGWWDTQECPPGTSTPSLCFENPNPIPPDLGITFVVAGLAIAGTVLVRDPRKGRRTTPKMSPEGERDEGRRTVSKSESGPSGTEGPKSSEKEEERA